MPPGNAMPPRGSLSFPHRVHLSHVTPSRTDLVHLWPKTMQIGILISCLQPARCLVLV
jgi:hypothetical protein